MSTSAHALVPFDSTQGLEEGYRLWRELLEAQVVAREGHRQRLKSLEEQGSFLVGAVRAAAASPIGATLSDDALAVPADGLSTYLSSAEAQLASARAAAERGFAEEDERHTRAIEECLVGLQHRVARFLTRVKPRLSLRVHPAGGDRRIVHVDRVSGDESVLLLKLFTGGIPSRYGYLFDDSTDDASLPPGPLYPEAGGAPRPDARGLLERLEGESEVMPIKGFLPLWVPTGGIARALFRLQPRGPVMELERADGLSFRSLLDRAEAEQVAGYLIRLKLEGRIELEIETG